MQPQARQSATASLSAFVSSIRRSSSGSFRSASARLAANALVSTEAQGSVIVGPAVAGLLGARGVLFASGAATVLLAVVAATVAALLRDRSRPVGATSDHASGDHAADGASRSC